MMSIMLFHTDLAVKAVEEHNLPSLLFTFNNGKTISLGQVCNFETPEIYLYINRIRLT